MKPDNELKQDCEKPNECFLNPCQVIDALDAYLVATPDRALHVLSGEVPGVSNEAGPRKGERMTRADWTRRVLHAKLKNCKFFFLGAPCYDDEWVLGTEDAAGRFVPGYMERKRRDPSSQSAWGKFCAYAAPFVDLPYLRAYLEAALPAAPHKNPLTLMDRSIMETAHVTKP